MPPASLVGDKIPFLLFVFNVHTHHCFVHLWQSILLATSKLKISSTFLKFMGKPPQCLIKQVPQASQSRLRTLFSAIFSLIASFSQRTSLYLPRSIRRRDFRGTRCRGDSWAVDFCQSGEPGTLVEQKAAHCDQTHCLMASLQASWWWFLIEGGRAYNTKL